MNVVIRACYVYPVKSAAGVRVDSLVFDASGQIVGDRQWVIVDERQCVTWMGAIPRLALVRPAPLAGSWALQSPTGETVPLPPAGEGAPCTVQAWNGSRAAFDSLAGHDAGDTVSAFLSEVAGKKLRVAWLAPRPAHSNAVHLTTVPSLQHFATWLGVNLDGVNGHRRFRPNLVLDAAVGETLSPFAEEQAEVFTRAPITLEVSGRCERCIMVDVDPDTAVMDSRYFVGTKKHSAQRHPGQPACFGIYARARSAGQLAVDDTLAMQLRG